MSTHRLHNEIKEVYFCTITCYKWLPLFEESEGYASVYVWFSHLKKKGCQILAYVIMPNHLHILHYHTNPTISLNKLVANGKRFIAYDIVTKLTSLHKRDLLDKLKEGVHKSEILKGKKHQVFRLSFDARKCFSIKMLEQKLDYIHHNPVKGKWSLANDFCAYEHSSASFYEKNTEGKFKVIHYKEIE